MSGPRDGSVFVEICGAPETMETLRLLRPSFTIVEVDPHWVNTTAENRLALTAEEWAELPSLGDAHAAARGLVHSLNYDLAQDSCLHEPVSLGAHVWQADATAPAGFRRSAFVFGQATAHSLATAEGKALVDGIEVARPRTRGVRERELAARNRNFSRALELYRTAGEDIRALFVAFEHLKKKSGHRPREFAANKQIDTFVTTANNAPDVRHVGGDQELPHGVMTGAEARDLVRRLLAGWLDAEIPV